MASSSLNMMMYLQEIYYTNRKYLRLGEVRLNRLLLQLVSLSQSWTADRLDLTLLHPEDWTELERLDSVREVVIKGCSAPAPPSVSLLETLWNKTEEEWDIDDEKYYKTNKEDFSQLVKKHFQ